MPSWFGVIMSALIAAGGLLTVQVLLNRWKRRERAEDIGDATKKELSELGQRLIDRYDASAAKLAADLAECRTLQADLYNRNLALLGDKAQLARENRGLQADLDDVRAQLSDTATRYVGLVSAAEEVGFVLNRHGRLVKKADSGEIPRQ